MTGTYLGCVEEQVGDTSTMDVVVLVGDIGENDSICDLLTRPAKGRLLKVGLSWRGEAKKPQDRVRDLNEDIEPDAEDEGVDLEVRREISLRLGDWGDETKLPCRAGSSWQR